MKIQNRTFGVVLALFLCGMGVSLGASYSAAEITGQSSSSSGGEKRATTAIFGGIAQRIQKVGSDVKGFVWGHGSFVQHVKRRLASFVILCASGLMLKQLFSVQALEGGDARGDVGGENVDDGSGGGDGQEAARGQEIEGGDARGGVGGENVDDGSGGGDGQEAAREQEIEGEEEEVADEGDEERIERERVDDDFLGGEGSEPLVDEREGQLVLGGEKGKEVETFRLDEIAERIFNGMRIEKKKQQEIRERISMLCSKRPVGGFGERITAEDIRRRTEENGRIFDEEWKKLQAGQVKIKELWAELFDEWEKRWEEWSKTWSGREKSDENIYSNKDNSYYDEWIKFLAELDKCVKIDDVKKKKKAYNNLALIYHPDKYIFPGGKRSEMERVSDFNFASCAFRAIVASRG